jgi:hypothetical protein
MLQRMCAGFGLLGLASVADSQALAAAPRLPHFAPRAKRLHTGFSALLAGGGLRAGLAYGATDEFGMNATEKSVHVHDLHATMLHLLGLDHERLTYRYAGRDFRLTDVFGRVVKDIIA